MTIKKKKTLSSIVVAAFAATALAVTASAASGSFSFYKLSPGEDDYSSRVLKSTASQTATVNVTDGDFVNSDRLYLRVVDAAKDFATETKWVNTLTTVSLRYTEQTGTSGRYYYLRGFQGESATYSVTARGTWTP